MMKILDDDLNVMIGDCKIFITSLIKKKYKDPEDFLVVLTHITGIMHMHAVCAFMESTGKTKEEIEVALDEIGTAIKNDVLSNMFYKEN